MKKTHKMVCCTIYVERNGPTDDWASAIQRTTQKMLDEGWTLRAAVNLSTTRLGGQIGAKPVLIFVRKEAACPRCGRAHGADKDCL